MPAERIVYARNGVGMSLGLILIHATLIMASQFGTKSCNLPCGMHSNLSSGDLGADYAAGQSLELPLDEVRQISMAPGLGSSGPDPTQVRDSQEALPQAGEQKNGSISGTVTDDNAEVIPGAEVTLGSDAPNVRQTTIADQNGFFEFSKLEAGSSYHVTVAANGFASWRSEVLHLDPGQFLFLNDITLKVDGGPVSVVVTASPVEIATEQVRIAEHQRVLGFIPNFLVVYDRDPAPLTAKLKFKLALRVAVDPVTFIGVAGFAAINQGANTPNYVQGLKGYGQRAGALYADGFTDLMLGGAILPSLLHQDPRYFYQGTGSTRSRLVHALMSPFWCRGDNGKWQVNYSSLGGNLASTAISESYYPASNRGAGLVFGNFAIGTGERMVSGLAQEFLLRKLTPGAAKNH